MEEIWRVLVPSGSALLVDYALDAETGALAGKLVPLIEFMAGSRHYRNFREYRRRGGLEGLCALADIGKLPDQPPLRLKVFNIGDYPKGALPDIISENQTGGLWLEHRHVLINEGKGTL